jgi:fatty-acyl-CoA synthase
VHRTAPLLLRLSTEARALVTLVNAGMLKPERPDRLAAMYRAFERYGAIGASLSAAAIRHGDRPGLIDERGSLTFTQLDARSNALANALRTRGIGPGDGVAILCRNHRGMYDASYGAVKAGARALYLNTGFAGPQAVEVCAREGVDALIYDDEFTDVVAGVHAPKGRFVAWTEARDGEAGDASLEYLIAAGATSPPPPPGASGTIVILTSGTTGTPKGANRSEPRSLAAAAAILSRIPLRATGPMYVAPPLHHAWGLGMSIMAMGLGATVVVSPRFDPEATLAALAEHRCRALAVVPVMLDRLLSLGAARIGTADLSALQVVASSGAPLDGALAQRTWDVLGDVLYNLYGSTEVGWATIATPADLRAAPGCAGRPPLGTTVRVLDNQGHEVPAGMTGRIFVRSGVEFIGYTGGGGKEVIDGLMSIGDVGHFDREGRLFVDGRDDEMIVSGGENVFPREVEDLLAGHPAVMEAAAIGTPDPGFGQRLRVYVAVRPGHSLDADAVRDYVRSNLARYKVPRDVVFVDQLPRTTSGKVLKRVLADRQADRL